MKPVCDIQYTTIENSFLLTKVGVTNVRKLVHVKRPESKQEEFLSCSFNVYVDLPAEQKGSHLSRNLETLREVVNDHASGVVTGIDDLAVTIGKILLKKHEYADNANVEIKADYFRDSKTPNGRTPTEIYKLIGGSTVKRNGEIWKTIGVEVVGMTACPCAQATVTEMLGCDDKYPVMSHNQRNVCTLILRMREKEEVEANNLIDLVERSFSSPTFEVLKRDDEGAVVINAHKNPKFVEDVVRTVLQNLVKEYSKLPDDTVVTVRSESEESIHKHNAFAERVAMMCELR